LYLKDMYPTSNATKSRKWSIAAALLALTVVMAGCGQKSSEGGGTGGAAQPTASVAPSAAPTPTATKPAKSWPQAPAMQIDPAKKYTAEVKTSKGSFTIELFADKAPQTVNNFVFLAKEGFYDGITFHRIIKSFMIQTGDPTGTGSGGPGYKFNDELPPAMPYTPGVVAMANAGPNTNGSQFFICTGNQAINLNQIPNFTVFGQLISGKETVQAIEDTPVTLNPRSTDTSPSMPTEKVTIDSIVITEK